MQPPPAGATTPHLADFGQILQETTVWRAPPETNTLISDLRFRDAFTLIELLMVVGMIAILSTIGITSYISFSQDARKAVTLDKLNVMKKAIMGDARLVSGGQLSSQGYELNCQGLPASLTDLVTMPLAGVCSSVYEPFLKKGWRGPYLNASDVNWNKDGWGIAIEYFTVGPPARTLRSCGPDLTCGNADDIAVTF